MLNTSNIHTLMSSVSAQERRIARYKSDEQTSKQTRDVTDRPEFIQ